MAEDLASIAPHFPKAQFQKLTTFANLLGNEGIERGLIGPGERSRIWDRHILNCAALGTAISPTGLIVDLGSGAGLPGVVLAIMRPEQEVVLLEPLLRRQQWLLFVAERLELANVTVVRGRAEEESGRIVGATVTSRAVAALPKLLLWSRPLLEPAGELVALKGQSVGEEIAQVPSQTRRGWRWPPIVLSIAFSPGLPPATIVKLARRG